MKKILIVTGLLLLMYSLKAQDSTILKINQVVKKWYIEGKFEGTVLVAHQGKVLYQRALGYANRSWNIPLEIDSKFEIASISKSMLGGVILKLQEAGKLQVTDKITKYYKFKDVRAKDITISQMLTHTSGIGNYDELPDSLKENNFERFKRWRVNRADYAKFLCDLPLKFNPNERMYYSNFAYFILVDLVEKIEKKPFNQVFQDLIAVPLGMKNTISPFDNRDIIKKQVTSYNWHNDKDNGYFQRNSYIDHSVRLSIYSTVGDLLKWGMAMSDTTFFSKVSLDYMTTNQVAHLRGNYAFGWATHSENSQGGMGNLGISARYILHGGNLEGFKSMLTIINGGEWIITHLSNIGNRTNELKLTQEIAKILEK